MREAPELTEFMLRIGVAVVLGAIIGLERQWRQRMAGLRTNTLVCVGAALFVSIATLTIEHEVSATRVAAQVVSGIGFIGAGVIFRQGPTVRGLTTAATLWCAAAVGALAGSGYLEHATIGTVAVLLANVALRPVTHKMERQPGGAEGYAQTAYRLTFSCRRDDVVALRTLLMKTADSESLKLRSLSSKDDDDTVRITAELELYGRQDDLMEQLLSRLGSEDGVSSLSWSVIDERDAEDD